MKKYIIFICFLVLVINACKEDAPCNCDPRREKVQGDTDYVAAVLATPQLHNVLLEDFTGVKCINCPAAHAIVKTIEDNNPGRIVVSGLHAYYMGVQTDSLNGFPFFRDSTADYIMQQLMGNPPGIPQGGIDRKLFSGEPNRYLDYSKWTNYVNQELPLTTPVNIEVTNTYNATTRELTAIVKIECTQFIADDIYLSLGITENNIIGKQKDINLGIIPNYVHNHVFRKLLTPLAGLKLNSSTIILDSKKVVIRVFNFTLPAGWNEDNCNVIGILHKNTSLINVVQSTEKKIK